MERTDHSGPEVSTGVPGLDEVLLGGLPPCATLLVEGEPGAGKTTLGLQFLLEGVRLGEPALHITLSENEAELKATARSHGWSLDGIEIVEMLNAAEQANLEGRYTMFHSSEVELGDSTRKVIEAVERTGARRVVIDSIAELRLMAENPLWFRRQLLVMKRFFMDRGCSVLLMEEESESQTRTIVEGVLLLEQMSPEYAGHRRRLRFLKVRRKPFRGSYHDFVITTGGLRVFPRLLPQEQGEEFVRREIRSGIPELDTLTGGGIPQGSSTMIVGPSGVGKSSVASRYLFSFLEEGGKVAAFLFDENLANFLVRAEGLGMDFAPHLQSGALGLQQVDPAELSPGEFTTAVRQAVDGGSRMVLIDSLGGYLNAMPDERFLILHMHDLLSGLSLRGVTTLMIGTQHGLVGEELHSAADLSYLADAVILLRFFEAGGEVRQAISMLKKRTGRHERVIRELKLGADGLRIGGPLRRFQGILTGHPSFTGPSGPLMEFDDEG